MVFVFFFFKQKTAYEIDMRLEFRRVLFRSHVLPRVAHRDLREDVRWCQRVVEQRDMELLVLDQTRPDIDAAVVRVIVPGLRHFRARYAPGRLYDTPVALGWLAKRRAEAELNPLELFM